MTRVGGFCPRARENQPIPCFAAGKVSNPQIKDLPDLHSGLRSQIKKQKVARLFPQDSPDSSDVCQGIYGVHLFSSREASLNSFSPNKNNLKFISCYFMGSADIN